MIQVQVGSKKLSGIPAVLAVAPLLALIAAVVVRLHARVGMLVSAGIWIAMMVYWSTPLKGALPAQRSESIESRKVHQRLLSAGLLLLFIPVPALTRRFLPESAWVSVAGLAIQAAGVLVYLWARKCLGALWSGAITIKEGHFIVASGPYRAVRHPMYTAVLAMYAGTTIVAGQYHALAGLALAIYAYGRKIRIEEGTLVEQFGESYALYRNSTRALIPWVV